MPSRCLLVALGLLLSSCQSAVPTGHAGPDQPGWQVLERVGEVHVRSPAAPAFAEIMASDRIAPGSTLVTGTGGRLILARFEGQVVVGTNSRLRLPGAGRAAPLEQLAGDARYRITGSAAAFAVTTPALNLSARDAVLEVSVATTGTAVTVEAGEVRVSSPDGASVGVVPAGGAARAGGPGDRGLMVRGAPQQTFEPVAPVLASRPRPAPAPDAAPGSKTAIGARSRTAPLAAASTGPAGAPDGTTVALAAPASLVDAAGDAELVVMPAGFARVAERAPPAAAERGGATEAAGARSIPDRGAPRKSADAEPVAAEKPRTAQNDAEPGAAPFGRLTGGLLNGLPVAGAKAR